MKQTFSVILERQNTTDNFSVSVQKIQTSIRVPLDIFKKIEYRVNEQCKTSEYFMVTAIVTIEPYLFYNKTSVTQSINAVLVSIQNFDKDDVLNKEITL